MPTSIINIPPNVREHMLECLEWFFDHAYSGEPLNGWQWGFIEEIAREDRVCDPQDYLAHVERLIYGGEE